MAPLSQSQLGLFYACQNPSNQIGNYQVPLLFELPASIDLHRLKDALDLLLKNRPYLLSQISLQDGIPSTQPLKWTPNTVSIQTIHSLDEVRSNFCRSINLLSDPLLRIEIYQTPQSNYLYLDIHHILIDGSSISVFFSFIEQAYNQGQIPDEGIDGSQVALQEAALRKTPLWEEERQWYTNTFGGGADTDCSPIASVLANKNEKALEEIDYPLALRKTETDTLCQKYQMREYLVFTAAWGKLLANYTANNKAFFATIYHGRNAATRNTLAMMVRTLPVYMEMPSDKSINDWLMELSEQQQQARSRKCYSFADLHQDLDLHNDLMFAYHGKVVPTSVFDLHLGDTLIHGQDLRVARPGLKLDGQLFETPNNALGGDYTLRISYNKALYTPAMMAGMAEAYTALLQSMITANTIGQLKAASAAQLLELDKLNPAYVNQEIRTVTSMFAEQVRLHPNHICCVYQQQRYTYQQVDELTNRLANTILKEVPPTSPTTPVVSYMVQRNEWMLLVPLAIAKTGYTYQPLDTSYPPERLDYMIKDADADLLICLPEFRQLVPGYTGKVLSIDKADTLVENNSALPEVALTDDTFVLLYTSGTTGTPKGVMISRSNIAYFCIHSNNLLHIDANSRLTAYASYGFDASMMDLWSALTSGAALHIIGEDIRYDLVALHNYLVSEQITHTVMTTQVGTQLAQHFPDIPSLQALSMGGEKLASFQPPSYPMYNLYGPTECTTYISHFKVSKLEDNVPIGRATSDTHLYIVNPDGQRVPMGACGELWSAGPQTSKGYLHLPEKTEKVFTRNPFDQHKGYQTLYHTGDIVRYREDGEIDFVGRNDGQVKIRGFRIELKEIESVIRSYPGVEDVSVQAFDLEAGGKALAAYLVAKETIDTTQLGQFILSKKPPYMVPAVFMQLDKIPLNVNGKVDKKRLPKPEITTSNSEVNEAAAPYNRLEEELFQLISKLTNCGQIAITTPLSYVGLSSISSIALATEVFQRYGVSLPTHNLASTASIQTIENYILEALLSTNKPAETPQPTAKQPVLSAPLSNAQLGVFLECMKNPQSTAYNVPFEVKFPSSVSSSELKQAVSTVIKAHPLLLAHFDNSGESPLQIINPDQTVEITENEGDIEELRKQFVQSFNLLEGPLYRACICGSTLLFDAHHLVTDGSSTRLILQQICRLLDNQTITEESYSFIDYAAHERQADQSEAEQYFSQQLQSVEETTSIPADLHGQQSEGRLEEVYQDLNHEAISGLAKSYGISPASIYLAAVEYVAARYSNTKDVCVCTVSSGRSQLQIANTVGMFVNTLPLVAHINQQSVSQYLKEFATHFSNTLQHENYAFAQLSAKYGLQPQLIFVYEVGVIEALQTRGQQVQVNEINLSAPKFDVSLLVEPYLDKIRLRATYNNALYSSDYMQRLLESINQVLCQFVQQPEAAVSTVSLVSPRQQKELEGMHCIATAPLPIRLLHQGMEIWATREPERTAVIATDQTLSYQAFNQMANRIGNALLNKGLKTGEAVVVLLPRKSTTIACIYGILKAGGAYIPCDPEYPTDRIQLIATDSQAPYVITTSDLVTNYGKRGLVLDDLLTNTNSQQPPVSLGANNLAYYIYTSGSTGRPKGVRVSHGNITTIVTPSKQHPMLRIMTECERICSVSTLSFDASIIDYALALFNGRTLVLANETEAKDPLELTKLLQQTQADCFGCTSSRMLQYLELPGFTDCVKHLKVFMQGGEKFSDVLLEKLRNLNSDLQILNGYGPTEISICCNAGILNQSKRITVGLPVPNYTEWVLDQDGNELPVGVTGELCVGGEGVTQGYHNLPEKTAEKFIQYQGMRAFKTGDYARWLPNGEIEILGRTDNQVKLRGLRIELGEVESAIAQVEGIKNVLVKICNLQGRDHLSAYFVADCKIDLQQLKNTIKRTLTSYMIPTAYLQMEAFPITPNGKIDFKHLPQPELLKNDTQYEAPVGEAECFFARTFAQILELDKVGANDSFFELGGTSLVVMRVVICAQKAGYPLTYADVFSNPTPRMLAQSVQCNNIDSKDPDADIRNFDYSNIHQLLSQNHPTHAPQATKLQSLGNVLLTGATGFLGIHICRKLLEDYPQSRVYCLLRSKHNISAKERLRQLLFYYFETDYTPLWDQRLFVVEGDITTAIQVQQPIDTLINCAAIVKHFAQGNEIEEVNVGGVKRCIDFCLAHHARLIQVSTCSVAGAAVNGTPDIPAFSEQMLFMGQRLHNQYIHSKIMAERYVLDAVVNQGLDAKIMRVGNLSARSQDGEFQINFKTNSFMGRLRIYQMLGVLPYSAYQNPVEFSPIDETADAICRLAQTPKEYTVFHPYNHHHQFLGDVLREMSTIGHPIRLVEDNEFVDTLNRAKTDQSKQEQLSALLAYESKDSKEFIQMITPDNEFTAQVLLRLGFCWSSTSWDYVDQFLKQINGLHFFDE